MTDTDTAVYSLQQLTGEQKLTAMDYQQLLFDAEERSTELLATNRQLTAALTDSEERLANLANENEQLIYRLPAYSELSIANQQLTVTLAEANERMEKLAIVRMKNYSTNLLIQRNLNKNSCEGRTT